MAGNQTPFEALGLAHDASPAEVKARWRELAVARHPDHGGDPEEFTALRQAYNDAYEAALIAPCQECRGTGMTTAVGFASSFHHLKLPCTTCGGSGRRY